MLESSLDRDDLTPILPLIKRARGGYLYTSKGDRYYDLFLHHGSYCLGHHPAGLALAFKNPLEQGLSMPYPNVWQQRLFKLIPQIIPTANCVSYYSEISPVLQTLSQPTIAEPWDERVTTTNIGYLRPHCLVPDHWHYGVLVCAPSLGGGAIVISLKTQTLPSSHIMPAYLARAALRSLKAFSQQTLMVNCQGSHFTLTQNYLRYTGSSADYPALHQKALAQYIWLAPKAHHTGLFLPHLFSDKQQSHIISFLSS